jgi:hypothetical protein
MQTSPIDIPSDRDIGIIENTGVFWVKKGFLSSTVDEGNPLCR